MASKEQKSLGLAVIALLAFGAMMVWVLTDSSASSRKVADEPPTAPSEPPPVAAAPPSTTAAKPAPTQNPTEPPPPAPAGSADLFAEEMPEFMQKLHARVLEKQWLDVAQQKELYEFGKAHPKDARPQLILAWDSMNREWDGIGVRMYAMAFHADKRAKDDPTMLRDLLDIASRFDRTEFRETVQIVKEAYGGEAIGPIDQKLSELRNEGALGRAAKLQRLRDAITGR